MEPHTPEEATDDESVWPKMSTDVRLARTVARSITLDTHRAATDGRIEELKAQFDEMQLRMLDVEKDLTNGHIAEQAATDITARFVEIQNYLHETNARFDELAARVSSDEQSLSSTMMQTVDRFDVRVAATEDAHLEQSQELQELMAYVERAFLRIDDLDAQLKDPLSQGENDLLDRLEALSSSLTSVREHVDSQNISVETRLDEQEKALASAQENLAGRLDDADQRLHSLLDQTNSLGQRIADLDPETTRSEIENIRAELEELAISARGASDLAEGLRDVQADLVKALQGELSGHGTRLDDLDETIAGLETKLSDDPSEITTQIAELDAKNLAHHADLAGLQERVSAVEELSGTSASSGSELRQAISNADTRINHVESSLVAIAESQQEHAKQIDETVARLDADSSPAVGASDTDTQDRLDTVESDIKRLTEDMRSAQDAATSAVAAHSVSGDEDSASQARVAELESQLSETMTTIEALSDVQMKTAQVDEQIADSIDELKERMQSISDRQEAIEATPAVVPLQAENDQLDALSAELAELRTTTEQLSSAQADGQPEAGSDEYAEASLKVAEETLAEMQSMRAEMDLMAARIIELESRPVAAQADQAVVAVGDSDESLPAVESDGGLALTYQDVAPSNDVQAATTSPEVPILGEDEIASQTGSDDLDPWRDAEDIDGPLSRPKPETAAAPSTPAEPYGLPNVHGENDRFDISQDPVSVAPEEAFEPAEAELSRESDQDGSDAPDWFVAATSSKKRVRGRFRR